MKLVYEGQTKQTTLSDWMERRELHPEQYEEMDRWAREAAIFTDDGLQLAGRTLQRVRDRLLETYDDLPRLGSRRPVLGPRRFLIPGLWPWGTIPALGGNSKAGKTTVVADLTRALLLPGYRFLGHFEPADLTDEERGRGVLVINAEVAAEDYEATIANGMPEQERGVLGPWDLLDIEHLEDVGGGAHFMDLTDPAIYDLWADRLAECFECDGSDDTTPAVVIVDGVTAIGQAIGKDPEDYFGKWYAAFRRLLHECDVSNGLATGHNTMQGGHLMGGTAATAGPDGLWTYSSDAMDRVGSKRRFSVRPRVGGVPISPTRVVMNEEGRPVIPSKAEQEPEEQEAGPDLVTVIAHRTAEYVREHPGADGEELTKNVEDGGWKENNLKGRAKALDLGLIRKEQCRSGCQHCKRPHPRRSHYYPV
ncbi:AAA family ATPase [Pimelobacter simplex]|uniref:AAA family ATPase n=1 Tax=Nocardioides simplex TaxID=2045 RepID=A0A7J5DQJ3_NOCSI|nr:AAA family ATPase [Pimelobacter simplex]KAB2806924.1 AAA family ATPase [Pimelobacter simplex]